MERLKRIINTRHEVDRRLAALESEIQECRQLNIRLAELCDIVAELVVPLAERDDRRIREAIDTYRQHIASPTQTP